MITVEDVSFGYSASLRLLDKVDRVVRAGDRIGLVGVNGSGKTTFLRVLIGELAADSGNIVYSKGVSIGYFAQEQLKSLRPEWSPLKHLLVLDEPPTDQEARDFLGGFGFSHQMCLEPCANFSGGEKARLALAIIVYQAPNLLILDEPTNHLDMETRDALDMALQNFNGALILVSHDKHLLSSIADSFWWVHQTKVSTIEGSLDDYLAERLKASQALKQSQKDTQLVESSGNKKAIRQINALNRKQLEAKVRPFKKQQQKNEDQMERIQAELDQIHQQLQSEDIYQGDSEALQALLKQQSKLDQLSENLEMEWMELESEIERIQKEAT
jgi:ATP-binding cassette subfamily F protein 3